MKDSGLLWRVICYRFQFFVSLCLERKICCIAGVAIYGGPVAHELLSIPKADSFHHEYSSMACTIEFVDDVQSAIDHIHRYGRYLLVTAAMPSIPLCLDC
jgi:hypothetical protein